MVSPLDDVVVAARDATKWRPQNPTMSTSDHVRAMYRRYDDAYGTLLMSDLPEDPFINMVYLGVTDETRR